MEAALRECSAEEVISNPSDPSSPFTHTLPFGSDPLLLALAFHVNGEANKLKVWNKLGPSGKFDRQSSK